MAINTSDLGLGSVCFIVRIVLFLFNINLEILCVLNKFFAICGIYACVTKHST